MIVFIVAGEVISVGIVLNRALSTHIPATVFIEYTYSSTRRAPLFSIMCVESAGGGGVKQRQCQGASLANAVMVRRRRPDQAPENFLRFYGEEPVSAVPISSAEVGHRYYYTVGWFCTALCTHRRDVSTGSDAERGVLLCRTRYIVDHGRHRFLTE